MHLRHVGAGGACSLNYNFRYSIRTTRSGRMSNTSTDVTEMHPFRPLQIGGVAQGRLADGDRVTQRGTNFVDYGINLTAGQPVTIVVRGGPSVTNPTTNLDVWAIIFNSLDQELINDDDSAGNLNSRIVFTPPTTGMFFLRITTASGDTQGAFMVQTWPGANPNAT
jgi:hypothetical protein